MPGSGSSQTNQTSADLTPSDTDAVAVSIVVPVRNEAENVAPLVTEIVRALDGRWVYEIIYVNDGSGDATMALLATLHDADPRVAVVDRGDVAGATSSASSNARS